MAALYRMELVLPKQTAVEMAAKLPSAGNKLRFFSWLATLFAGLPKGLGAMLRLGLDESTPKAATGTVVFTQANLTVGDKVIIDGTPYTCVAGAATASLGEFSKDTSDTAVGDSFVLALAAFPSTNAPRCVGVNTAGSVALTWSKAGICGNSVLMQEVDAAGGIAITQFSGGREAGSLMSITGTFTGVAVANDTHVIGGVTLTWKASAGNENEITIGADAAGCATALIAAINAHSKLKGLVVASSGGSGIAVMQLQLAGRVGNLVTCTESVTNYTQTATSFAPAGTEAWAASPVVAAIGPASSSPQA